MKPRRGRQRKYWCKVVDHLFSSLGLDKAEWLEDIRKGSCSLKNTLWCCKEPVTGTGQSSCKEPPEALKPVCSAVWSNSVSGCLCEVVPDWCVC